MPARIVPNSVTPVSSPSGVSSTEDTIWSKTFFGSKSFFIGLPPPVKFVHVLGGNDDNLIKPSGTLAPQPSPKSGPPARLGKRLELREGVFHQPHFGFPPWCRKHPVESLHIERERGNAYLAPPHSCRA